MSIGLSDPAPVPAAPVPAGVVPADLAAPDPASEMPSLSPSRAMDFISCPRLYRFRVIDRLPEPPSLAAVRGTLIHAVLEQLFDLPAARRQVAAAQALISPTWARLRREEPRAAALFESQRVDEAGWLASAAALLERYFDLEDPRRYEPAERELMLETPLPQGLLLRGILDRLDQAPDGRLRVVDYKTGFSPRPGREHRALFQLKFYAVMLWRARRVVPSVLRLVYLGDSVIVEYSPTESELRATERVLLALNETVQAALVADNYPAVAGPRCSWCSFSPHCEPGSSYLSARTRSQEVA